MWRPDREHRWDLLLHQLEEAGFLWAQWESALASPSWALSEIVDGPERRLRAHLDALAQGGKAVSAKLLLPALRGEDAELARAAAAALLTEGEGQDPGAVVSALVEGDEASRAPLARALEVIDWSSSRETLSPLSRSNDPALAAIALDLLAAKRGVPGEELRRLLCHRDPRVLASALRAARQHPALLWPDLLVHALRAPEPAVRQAALEAGLVAGHRTAWNECAKLADRRDEPGRTARLALAVGGGPEETAALVRMLDDPELRREALWALGFGGRGAGAEACLRWLDDDEVGGVAAEAFSAITGLEISGRFTREPVEDHDDTDEELDEELETDLSPDFGWDLPLAARAIVEHWWDGARRSFDPSQRYLRGKPFDLASLVAEIEDGPARRRGALAFELSVRSQGAVHADVRAFGEAQRRQLEPARSLPAGSAFTRPFGAGLLR